MSADERPHPQQVERLQNGMPHESSAGRGDFLIGVDACQGEGGHAVEETVSEEGRVAGGVLESPEEPEALVRAERFTLERQGLLPSRPTDDRDRGNVLGNREDFAERLRDHARLPVDHVAGSEEQKRERTQTSTHDLERTEHHRELLPLCHMGVGTVARDVIAVNEKPLLFR